MAKVLHGKEALEETGMQCVLCGGCTAVQLVETDFALEGERFWLVDVPAEVCQACSEPYFELAVYDEMAREARRLWRLRHSVS